VEERDDEGRKRGGWTPWLLGAPSTIFLILFFVLPTLILLEVSLSIKPNVFLNTTVFSWNPSKWQWGNYSRAFSTYGPQFWRSFEFAITATQLSILIGFPVAYVIAFRGGRFKNLLLGLVVVPFFTNYLIRTIAWKTIVGDSGTFVSVLRDVGILSSGGTLLRTTTAVIGGLTYNFLAFMILPIYVALEKIDPTLLDAARDLYSTSWRAFWKVVVPLSMPGVFAGSLLVFIPAAGDFVNAEFLGSPKQSMIGSVIQSQFLNLGDSPAAAALAFVFMAAVMVLVVIYARFLGTEDLV
jgi:spermidine/putrescine transport system permease protein